MAGRKIYLDSVPVAEFWQRIHRALVEKDLDRPPAGEEEVAAEEAVGRVLSRPVFARLSSPGYPAAAIDGVAVRAEQTFGAAEATPLTLKVPEDARWVDTGDQIPAGFNAVIMVEDLHRLSGDTLEIIAAASPGQHVRPVGEDLVAGELILPAGHRVRALDLGALLAGGAFRVTVWKPPRVALIPTGDEIVEPGTDPGPGQVVESNSRVQAALLREWGAEAVRWPVIRDDPETLAQALQEAAGCCHLVVVNAGSSAGAGDYTARVLEQLGTILVHGMAARPGKPVLFGFLGRVPVLGAPGYPFSSFLAFDLFVKPMLHLWLGLPVPQRQVLQAVLARRVVSPLGSEEFVRVKVGRVGERTLAFPLPRGAGLTSTLARADGLLRVPAASEGLEEGGEVEVELLVSVEAIAATLLVTGSHDVILDLLANRLARATPGARLSSAPVGSLAGLMAVRRGETHLAGIHLLDEETGEYNLPYVRRFLPGKRAVLVTLAHREQGLMVRPGNPKGISGIRDLAGPGVTFVNRQRGSGTRMLLDYHLRREGVDPASIAGYDREEFTHLGVAAAVAAGIADTGPGILAAARAFGLDFIPVGRERYDLLIPAEQYEHPLVQEVLGVLRSPGFQAEVRALGGYTLEDTGQETWVG